MTQENRKESAPIVVSIDMPMPILSNGIPAVEYNFNHQYESSGWRDISFAYLPTKIAFSLEVRGELRDVLFDFNADKNDARRLSDEMVQVFRDRVSTLGLDCFVDGKKHTLCLWLEQSGSIETTWSAFLLPDTQLIRRSEMYGCFGGVCTRALTFKITGNNKLTTTWGGTDLPVDAEAQLDKAFHVLDSHYSNSNGVPEHWRKMVDDYFIRSQAKWVADLAAERQVREASEEAERKKRREIEARARLERHIEILRGVPFVGRLLADKWRGGKEGK
jgi:hypothetical protein